MSASSDAESAGKFKDRVAGTNAGSGKSHKWSFQLTLPSSVIGLPVVARMAKAMSFTTTEITAYGTPSIISLR